VLQEFVEKAISRRSRRPVLRSSTAEGGREEADSLGIL
jgi:hypothetical protein